MPRLPAIHSRLMTLDVHGIVHWEHADATARLAESVAAGDVGKVSHQLVDGTFFVLADVTPTWKQLV